MAERHVVPGRGPEGGWKVLGARDGTTKSHTTTQASAIAEARDELVYGDGGELLIHGIDGQVKDKRTVPPQRSA